MYTLCTAVESCPTSSIASPWETPEACNMVAAVALMLWNDLLFILRRRPPAAPCTTPMPCVLNNNPNWAEAPSPNARSGA